MNFEVSRRVVVECPKCIGFGHRSLGQEFSNRKRCADRYLANDLARQNVEEVVLTGRPPRPEPKAVNGPAGWISGFSILGEETFSCGGQERRVTIYPNDTFTKARGLRDDQTDIACESI